LSLTTITTSKGFGKTTTLRIESNAAGWWVFPGGTIYALLMFKLTRKGFVALHASSVSRGDKAYVFTGRSGTGKTITVFNLTKRGFRYLGDDTTIIGNGEAFSFVKPLNIRFTYDVRRMLGLTFGGRERLSIFLKNILRIISMGYINLFTKVDVRDIFPDCIGTKGTLDKLFFMVSSPRFSIQEAPDRAPIVRQMFMNMLFELEELSGYLLAYTYVFPDSDLREFWKNARRIIEESVERKSTYSVSMPFTYSHEDFKRLEKAIA
jgi:hypothetical protein